MSEITEDQTINGRETPSINRTLYRLPVVFYVRVWKLVSKIIRRPQNAYEKRVLQRLLAFLGQEVTSK